MGSMIGYLASHSKKFPVQKLANFFSLASALEESPQLFNGEITEIFRKVTSTYSEHLWNNVVHLNFHGAARD